MFANGKYTFKYDLDRANRNFKKHASSKNVIVVRTEASSYSHGLEGQYSANVDTEFREKAYQAFYEMLENSKRDKNKTERLYESLNRARHQHESNSDSIMNGPLSLRINNTRLRNTKTEIDSEKRIMQTMSLLNDSYHENNNNNSLRADIKLKPPRPPPPKSNSLRYHNISSSTSTSQHTDRFFQYNNSSNSITSRNSKTNEKLDRVLGEINTLVLFSLRLNF
jgi:hypothetical protein